MSGKLHGKTAYAYRNAEVSARGPAYSNGAKKKSRFNFGALTLVLSAVLVGSFLGGRIYTLIPRPAPLNFGEAWEYSEAEYLASHAADNPYGSPAEVSDALELWQLAYAKLLSEPCVTVTTRGETRASGVTQSIDNVKKFDAAKNYLYAKSVSAGFVTVQEEYFYDIAADAMRVKVGSGAPAAAVSIRNFLPVYGNSPRGFLNYEISGETVTGKTEIAKEGEVYRFTLTLDPLPATDRYTRQVYHMAGGASPMPDEKKPVYEAVSVTVDVAEDFRIAGISVEESYRIFTPMKTKCKAQMTETYDYSPVTFGSGEVL